MSNSTTMTHYWIKGDDGDEYGPTDLIEMEEWVREDRAGHGTLVRVDGETEWKPWQSYPELQALLTKTPGAALFPGDSTFSLELASVLWRGLAYTLDVFTISMLAGLVNVFLPAKWAVNSEAMMHRLMDKQALLPNELWFVLGTMTLYILYFTYFHGSTGQTPGKKLCRIRVVDENGLTIGYWRAFVRAVGSLVSQMPYYAGFFVALVTRRRQTLHDLIARTFVIRQPA